MRDRADGFEALMTIVPTLPAASLLGGIVRELLLPRTDAGVAMQVVVVAVIGATAFWLARSDRDIRTFVLGCVVFTYAFFGLRAVH